MMVEEILERLEHVTKSGDGQWKATCPAHDDKNPSLSVCVGSDGTTLIRCHAGCRTEDVVRAVGLELKDLFASSPELPTTRSVAASIWKPLEAEDERGAGFPRRPRARVGSSVPSQARVPPRNRLSCEPPQATGGTSHPRKGP